MHLSKTPFLLWLCILCVLPAAARAQQDDAFSKEDEEAKGPVRKTASYFFSPACKTPSEQLRYCDALVTKGELAKAGRQYNRLVCAWPNAPEAPVAQKAYAELLLARGKHESAFEQYQYLVDFYPGRFPFAEALEKQFQIANYLRTAKYARLLGILPGMTDPHRALPLFTKIVQNAPAWERSQEAMLYIALIHEEDEEYGKAVDAYEDLLQRHPTGTHAAAAAFAKARCLYRAATDRLRDEGQLSAAASAFSKFLRDFPSDANTREARQYLDEVKEVMARLYFERAEYYDKTQKNPKAAVIAYRDLIRTFPMSALRERAESRILELTGTKEVSDEK